MKKKDIDFLFQELGRSFWSEDTELHYATPFQLVVAVILSAQCTDKRVNQITPALFEAMPNALAMSEASVDTIYEYIKSCSYPNNKAKSLSGMAKRLLSEFGAKVPESLKDLQTLPWVGLKTAKVVAHVLYHAPVIAVDTHVLRVSNRLGLVSEMDRDKCSELLEKVIPEQYKSIAHHSLIYFGRYHCTARKPKCDECPFVGICKYYKSLKLK